MILFSVICLERIHEVNGGYTMVERTDHIQTKRIPQFQYSTYRHQGLEVTFAHPYPRSSSIRVLTVNHNEIAMHISSLSQPGDLILHRIRALITAPMAVPWSSPPLVLLRAPLLVPVFWPPLPFSGVSVCHSRAWAHRRQQAPPCAVFVSLAVPRVVFRAFCPVYGAS